MQSYLIPTGEPQASAGPSIESPDSRLDNDFDFQIVVFEVYFLVFKSSHNLKETITTFFSKRSKIRSLRYLGMVSTFRELLSRQCFHYRRHKRIVLKGAVLKIPSICQEPKWTTFDLSCASYIRCEFLMTLSV